MKRMCPNRCWQMNEMNNLWGNANRCVCEIDGMTNTLRFRLRYRLMLFFQNRSHNITIDAEWLCVPQMVALLTSCDCHCCF